MCITTNKNMEDICVFMIACLQNCILSIKCYNFWSKLNILLRFEENMAKTLLAQCSGRTLVIDWQIFPVLRSTYSWWVTTYVGKPSDSAFHPFGVYKWVVGCN